MIEHSASMMNIGPRLLELQQALKIVDKSATGQVGNQRTKYAPLDDCLREVMPKANALGLLLLQAAVPAAHPGQVGVCTTLLHVESGEYISATMPFWPPDGKPQTIGQCVTYGRRYQLALVGLLTDVDADGSLFDEPENGGGQGKSSPPPQKTPPPSGPSSAARPAPAPAGGAAAAPAPSAAAPARPAGPGSGPGGARPTLDPKKPNPAARREDAISVSQDNRLHAIIRQAGVDKSILMAYISGHYFHADGSPVQHTYDLAWKGHEYDELAAWIEGGGLKDWAVAEGLIQ